MEFSSELEFSEPQYGGEKRGLLTLGENKIIQLENGKSLELLPYLVETHVRRGTSKMIRE